MKYTLIKVCFVLTTFIASSISAHGWNPQTESFEMVKGTESLSIRSIAQDEKNRLWFGTDKNLYSYDGFQPIVHTDRRGDNDHFQINAIECLGDRLLLGCVDGIVFYDCIKESFTTCEILRGNEVFAFYRDGQTIWIGSEIGLYEYDVISDEITPVVLDGVESAPINIRSISMLNGNVLVGTRKLGKLGVVRNVQHDNFFTYPDEMFPISFSSIDAIQKVDDRHLLLGSSSSLIEFDTATQTSRLIAPFSWVKTICKDNDQYLVGTDNGLFSYSTKDGKTVRLFNNVVWKTYVDNEENIWLGSDTGLLVSKRKKLIKNTNIAPQQANNLFSSICGDDEGNIFAGGSYGIIQFNGNDFEQPCKWYKMTDPLYPINHNKIRQIKQNPYSGEIWSETVGGIIRYDKNTEKFIALESDVNLGNSYDMILGKDHIWVAGLNGLYYYKDGKAREMYTNNEMFSSNRIAQVAKDCNGNIWLRTLDRNVYVVDIKNETISQFYLRDATKGSLWDYIYSDSTSNIWLCSGNFVYKVEPRISYRIASDYELEGQKTAETSYMIDVENTIWTCSSAGLFIIDKSKGLVNHVNTDENYVSLYYDRNSRYIYLGALDKIDYIRLDDYIETSASQIPKIHITKIMVNDDITIPIEDYLDGQITLPHNQNNISIYFSCFNYSIDDARRFRFNLGESSEWFETENSSNKILLTSLAPDTYTLYASTMNHPDDSQKILQIRIRHPWYSSAIAYIIYSIVSIALLLYLLGQYIKNKQIKIERIQKAKEIAQAKSKITFFEDIAHEFKTPLSLIIAPVSKLLKENTDSESRETLQLIHDNAMKINSLIHMSLDYYKENKDIANTVIKSNVEFVSFASQIFHTFESNFPQLDFNFVTNKDEIQISMDIVKMETVLTNIISNACKYTPSGGSIIMSIAHDTESGILAIKISDTGIGIPSKELPYVFQRYYQSSRTKNDSASTGLGLSIVKSYVDILNGEILAESDQYGTSFLIKLPVAEPDSSDVAEQSAEFKENKKNPVIVIIDDNKPICDFLVSIFKGSYNCLCANNGAKGLKLCRDVMPDLIISDVVMPDMNGIQLCREIRNTPNLAVVPIILLTAKDDEETEKSSIELNIDAVIGKPFDMESLLARVHQLIAKSEQIEKKVRIDMIMNPKEDNTVSADEKFLIDVTKIIENHIDEPELSVTKLCELCNYPEKYVYRKIKKLTGMSTVEYIRSIRMKKAAMLLQTGKFSISEVMYMVGFSNTSYFSKAFAAQFEKTPKDYMQFYKDSH